MSEEAALEAIEQCGCFLDLSATGRLARRVDESHDAFPLISTIAAAWNGMQQVRIHVLTDLCAGTLQVPDLDILGRPVPVDVFDIERVVDRCQDAELHHRFRALTSFRHDLLAMTGEIALEDGEDESVVFVDDAGRRLTDAEEFSDFQRCRFSQSISGEPTIPVDGYAFDEADGSLALVIADFCGIPDMASITAGESTKLFARVARYATTAFTCDLSSDGKPQGDPGIGLAADMVRQKAGISRLRLYSNPRRTIGRASRPRRLRIATPLTT